MLLRCGALMPVTGGAVVIYYPLSLFLFRFYSAAIGGKSKT
jgi:hypothetical protein